VLYVFLSFFSHGTGGFEMLFKILQFVGDIEKKK